MAWRNDNDLYNIWGKDQLRSGVKRADLLIQEVNIPIAKFQLGAMTMLCEQLRD